MAEMTIHYTPFLTKIFVDRHRKYAATPAGTASIPALPRAAAAPAVFVAQPRGSYMARAARGEAILQTAAAYKHEVAEAERRTREYKAAIRAQVEAVNALSPELSPAASAQVADLSAKMSVLEGQFKPPAVAFGSVCGDLRGKLAQCMADHKDDALACQGLSRAFAKCGASNAL